MSRKPLKYGKRFSGKMPVAFTQGTPPSGMKRRRPMNMEKRFLASLTTARYRAQMKPPTKVRLSFLEDER